MKFYKFNEVWINLTRLNFMEEPHKKNNSWVFNLYFNSYKLESKYKTKKEALIVHDKLANYIKEISGKQLQGGIK